MDKDKINLIQKRQTSKKSNDLKLMWNVKVVGNAHKLNLINDVTMKTINLLLSSKNTKLRKSTKKGNILYKRLPFGNKKIGGI